MRRTKNVPAHCMAQNLPAIRIPKKPGEHVSFLPFPIVNHSRGSCVTPFLRLPEQWDTCWGKACCEIGARCNQNRDTRNTPPAIATASSKSAMGKSGTLRAFTRRVRAW